MFLKVFFEIFLIKPFVGKLFRTEITIFFEIFGMNLMIFKSIAS